MVASESAEGGRLSGEAPERGMGEEVFYRYMSDAERKVVEETGMLRGGRGAGREASYWTDEVYDSAALAKARLALGRPPEVRLAFRITSGPRLVIDGERVLPHEGEPGGALEWMTTDAVEVEVIGYVYFND